MTNKIEVLINTGNKLTRNATSTKLKNDWSDYKNV